MIMSNFDTASLTNFDADPLAEPLRLELEDDDWIEYSIVKVCEELKELLVEKNIQYGNSALDPLRVFSRSSTDEQLRVRIDDKLSRLARGNESIENDDDVIFDLLGYLVLLLVHRRGS